MPKGTRSSKSQSKSSRSISRTRSQDVSRRTLRSHNGKLETAERKKKKKDAKKDAKSGGKPPDKKIKARKRKMICKDCQKEFSYELAFKRHVKTKLCGKSKKKEGEKKRPRGRPAKKQPKSEDASEDESRSTSSSPPRENEGPVRCSVCRNTYRSKEALENHTSACVPYSSSSELDSEDDDEVEMDEHHDPKRRPEYEEEVVVSDEDYEDDSEGDEVVPDSQRNGVRLAHKTPSDKTVSDTTSEYTSSEEESSEAATDSQPGDARKPLKSLSNPPKSPCGSLHNDMEESTTNASSRGTSERMNSQPTKGTEDQIPMATKEGLGGRISDAVIRNSISQLQDPQPAVIRHIEPMPPCRGNAVVTASVALSSAEMVPPSNDVPRVAVPSSLKSPSAFSISSLGLDSDDSNKSREEPSKTSLVASVERFFSTPSSTNVSITTTKSQVSPVSDISSGSRGSSSSTLKLPTISPSESALPPNGLLMPLPQKVSPSEVKSPTKSTMHLLEKSNPVSPVPVKPQVSPGAATQSLMPHSLSHHVSSRPPPANIALPTPETAGNLSNLNNNYVTPTHMTNSAIVNSTSAVETITVQDASGQVVRIQMPMVPSLSPSIPGHTAYRSPPLTWQQQQHQVAQQHYLQQQHQQQLIQQQYLQQQQQLAHQQYLHQQQQLVQQQYLQQQGLIQQQQQYQHPLAIQHYQHQIQMQAQHQLLPNNYNSALGYAQSQYSSHGHHAHSPAAPWLPGNSGPVSTPLPVPTVNPALQPPIVRNNTVVLLQQHGNSVSHIGHNPMVSPGSALPSMLQPSNRELIPAQQNRHLPILSGAKQVPSPEKQNGLTKPPTESCPCDVCLRRVTASSSALNSGVFQQCLTAGASGVKRKSDETKTIDSPRKLKKILPAIPVPSIDQSPAKSAKHNFQQAKEQISQSSQGNVAVVRPLENPLQKLSDQISKLDKTLEHPVPPQVSEIRAKPAEKRINGTVANAVITKEPGKTHVKKKAVKSATRSVRGNSKSIKVTLKRKEGGDSYAIKDVCETGEDGGGTMRSLKIKARITTGEQAGTATEVVVLPTVHVVPIPYGEDGDRTIAEEDGESVSDKPVSPSAVATSMDDLILDKSTGMPKTMTHRTVIVYEVKCNDKVLFRSSDVRTIWGHVFELVQGKRMNKTLPPLSYPSTDIALPDPKSTPSTLGFNTLGLVHRAVQFLLQQLPEPESQEKPKQKARKKVSNYIEDARPESPTAECVTGCARTEGFKQRKPFDMFGWLASKHRSLPTIESCNEASKSELPISLAHMRYKTLREKSPRLLGVFYSTIHGRGLFTRRDIEAGEMVIEYAGEVIRSVLEDFREREYESKGYGCYMFRIDEYEVVDATMRGNAARFINHSCEPNCKSKVVEIQGKPRILIFALRKILGGEELTYDYNFPKEKKDKKLPCTCGSQRCRKFLN